MKHLTWGRWHMWGNCAWGGWYEVGFISFLMFIACNGTDVWLMDEKMFGCRAITNLSFSLKDSGTFSALKKTSDRTSIALVSLTFAAHNRQNLGSAWNKVCLDWRHKRGRRSHPPNNFSILLTYKSWQTITKTVILLFISIYSYVWKKNKIYFQVSLKSPGSGILSK